MNSIHRRFVQVGVQVGDKLGTQHTQEGRKRVDALNYPRALHHPFSLSTFGVLS